MKRASASIIESVLRSENFLVFQLISGGGAQSIDNADSSIIVQEACQYYQVNQDFTLEHQVALKKLYPHLKTFKELAALCQEDVRNEPLFMVFFQIFFYLYKEVGSLSRLAMNMRNIRKSAEMPK